MIETLRIRDLAVVESVELEFVPGLNVLTGETGAGKSLVLGALGLLAGGRASADLVREGAEQAVVEAVLRTEGQPELEAELAERDLAPEDHELVVRRSVSRAGRSRAEVAGRLVPVSVLAELFGGRIEIASQHESQSLLRPGSHGLLLDAFGGLLGGRAALARVFGALAGCDAELARLRGDAEERTRRRDYLAFQIQEIDDAKLQPGELDALTAERTRLLHAERLHVEAGAAAAALAGDPALSDAAGASDLVADASRRVGALAELDGELGELATRLAAADAELRDAAAELERYAESIEADPGRLAQIEERLARLEGLRRKYGASSEEILDFRERAAAELAEAEGADERIETLEAERSALAATLASEADELSAGRKRAGRKLARAVEAALHELALPDAGFAVELEPAAAPDGVPCGASGREAPAFQFRANPGEPARPLRKVASGGELSRLFLALRHASRSARGGGAGLVSVFDEVDAGVGGRVADRVGRHLAELAEDTQVLCITHLPQIAALGVRHLQVAKRTAAGRSVVDLTQLDGKARVEEIARMAGGESITAATRRHARDLLQARSKS